MPEIDELAALRKILTEEYDCLSEVGSTEEGFETVAAYEGDDSRWYRWQHVITRTPSGEHYRWDWQLAATEMQESYGPHELRGGSNPIQLTRVRPVEKQVTVIEWVTADVQ